MIQKLNQTAVYLCLLVAAIGLFTFAYLGFYNRYWADDWCYNNDFKHQGIIKSVGTYFDGENPHRGYSPNRYSLTLVSGLLYLPGMFGTQILATLTIGLWLIALVWIGQNLNQFESFTRGPLILLAVTLLLFYTLYLSPHRFQILYWRSGVLPYSWTIISGLYILGLITSQLTREQPSKSIIYSTGLISFLGGGFSEVGSAFLLSGATLLLLATWLGKRKSKDWAVRTYATILTAWIFLIVALIALAVSPSNARYVDLNRNPNDPVLVPFLSLRYAFDFILYSLLGLPLPHAIVFLAFAGIGILSHRVDAVPYEIKKSVLAVLLTFLITYLLVTAIEAPTTYFYSAPPDPRGQSLARFVVLAGMAIVAWIIGATVASKLGKVLVFLPAILLLLCSAYTVRATLNVYRDLPGFMERAHLWDLRDANIKDSIAQGSTQIEIIPIDTKDINTRDMIRSEAFGKWVTDACGVQYYDAEAMRVAP
ncbi:MAG TPA: DUF6056 family protein, partial [Anaerolineales bacterium]|nr:DUF6056 family protein [Anaerolineales bacterium]